jgi:CRP-like cAMP-binding protein
VSIYAYQLLKGLGISEQRLLRVLPKVQVQSLDPDHVICRKGFRTESLSHVLSGLVCAGVPETDGSITPIHILGPGTWFGVDAVLNPEALALETV